MNEGILAALIFFVIMSLGGWLTLILGLRERRSQRRREEKERARATGVILDYARSSRRAYRGSTLHRIQPVIAYRAEGRDCQAKYENNLSPETHHVGSEVELLYDPDDPARFHLADDPAFERGGATLTRIGLAWFLIVAVIAALLTPVLDARMPFSRRRVRLPSITRQKKEDLSYGDFTYSPVSSTSVILTGYRGSDRALVIPSLLDRYLVTGLAPQAISRSRTLESVIVPGTISKIPIGAFAGDLVLKSVELRQGVQSIDASAFLLCPSLKDVCLPASLDRIADDAFGEDCQAVFHVVEDSPAHEFCTRKGYATVFD